MNPAAYANLTDPFIVLTLGLYILGLGALALCDRVAARAAERCHWAVMEAEVRAERRAAKRVALEYAKGRRPDAAGMVL